MLLKYDGRAALAAIMRSLCALRDRLLRSRPLLGPAEPASAPDTLEHILPHIPLPDHVSDQDLYSFKEPTPPSTERQGR